MKMRYELLKMSHFSEPYCHSKIKIKVELYLSNYATKSELKKRNSFLIHQILLKSLN